MRTIQIMAGTSLALFDLVRSVPLRRIVPDGDIIIEPMKGVGRYDDRHVASLLRKLNVALAALKEDEPVAVLLLYVDYGDESTEGMLRSFFPFALARPFSIQSVVAVDRRVAKPESNKILDAIVSDCAKLRATASVVRGYTHIANMSPLLLPLKNFDRAELDRLTHTLYTQLGRSDDPKGLMEHELANFEKARLLVRSPTSDKRCFFNGVWYFNSPGRDRHGFFRNASADQHELWCLPSARSRFGGAFDYRFHFDVTNGSKERISGAFPDCHDGDVVATKSTHVNIAPNDFVI